MRESAASLGEVGQPEATAAAQQPADALHRAAKAGDLDGLNAALSVGVDVNARDSQGWTALMHAANKGYTLLVEPLLAVKADPDVQAADGATALFMAAVHGHSEDHRAADERRGRLSRSKVRRTGRQRMLHGSSTEDWTPPSETTSATKCWRSLQEGQSIREELR